LVAGAKPSLASPCSFDLMQRSFAIDRRAFPASREILRLPFPRNSESIAGFGSALAGGGQDCLEQNEWREQGQ
jgi:hypothetical protein